MIVKPCSVSPVGTIRDIGVFIVTTLWIFRAFDKKEVTYADVAGKFRYFVNRFRQSNYEFNSI